MRSSPNFDVIKEPRGFIKCLEVFLAIFAFSCATGFRGEFQIHQTSASTSHQMDAKFKYPFDGPMLVQVLEMKNSSMTTTVEVPLGERSSTEFFVVIGVFCFLYSLAMIIYYIFFEEDNSRNSTASSNLWSAPVIDFAFGSFWALFWFFSACAFAASVNRIHDLTDIELLINSGGALHPYCSNGITCSSAKKANYATLTVTILLGFLNVFVWFGNLWFLWKETPWHGNNERAPAATVSSQPHQETPPPAAL